MSGGFLPEYERGDQRVEQGRTRSDDAARPEVNWVGEQQRAHDLDIGELRLGVELLDHDEDVRTELGEVLGPVEHRYLRTTTGTLDAVVEVQQRLGVIDAEGDAELAVGHLDEGQLGIRDEVGDDGMVTGDSKRRMGDHEDWCPGDGEEAGP